MSTANVRGTMPEKEGVHKLLTRRNNKTTNIPQLVKKNTIAFKETQGSPKLKRKDELAKEHKTEIDLLTVSLAITRSEIAKIDKGIAAKRQHLAQLEQDLEKENKKYEAFVGRTEKKIADARELFEKNRQFKESTVAAIEKLNNEIGTIESEISKNEGVLNDFTRFKNIMLRLLSSEWLDAQETESRLDRDPAKVEEKLKVCMSSPRHLLDQLIEIKEKTLFLFENSSKVDEPLEDLEQAIETTSKTLTLDEEDLTSRINKKKIRLDEINQLIDQLKKNIQLHDSLKTVDQDVLLKALDVKITKVRKCCKNGWFLDLDTTLEKLTAVEEHITQLYEQIENIPEQVFKKLKQIKDSERKTRMREEKLRQDEEKRTEMLKKCLRRSLSETKKPTGKKLLPRSILVEQRTQAKVEKNVPVEDETDIYRFPTEEEVAEAKMKSFFKEEKKPKETQNKNEQAAQKFGKQTKEDFMTAKKFQLSHEQTRKVNLEPTFLPPISNKDKLKSKDKLQPLYKEGGKVNQKPIHLPPISNPCRLKPTDNLASKKTTAGQRGDSVKGSNTPFKVTGDSLPKLEKTRSTKQNSEQNKPKIPHKKNSKVDPEQTRFPTICSNKVMDSWSGPVKLDCPIIILLELHKKRTEEEQVKAEKEGRERVLEGLEQRIVELCSKLKEAREAYKNYDKFLKDKDAVEAVKKAEREGKEALLKEANRKRLEEHFNELLQRNQELQCQVQKQAAYQKFMDQLVRITAWKNMEEFMCHAETLLQVSDRLYQTKCETQDHACKLRKKLRRLQDQHHLLQMHMNSQHSELQSEIVKATSELYKWQRTWKHIQETAAQKTLSLGKIKMATLNLYEMISVKGEGGEGVDMTDTEQQLLVIKMFIQDYNDIVKRYEMQLQKSSEAGKKH